MVCYLATLSEISGNKEKLSLCIHEAKSLYWLLRSKMRVFSIPENNFASLLLRPRGALSLVADWRLYVWPASTIADQSFKRMTAIRSQPFFYVEHLGNFRRKAA
jgi:hypothetical protein